MEILRVLMVNNEPRVWCLGDTNLIPGQKPQAVDKSYLENPEVKEAIEKGHLTVIEGGKSDNQEEKAEDKKDK